MLHLFIILPTLVSAKDITCSIHRLKFNFLHSRSTPAKLKKGAPGDADANASLLSDLQSEALDVGFTDFRLRCAFPAPVDAEESSWMVESPGLIHVELVKAKRDADKLPEGFEWWKSAFVVSALLKIIIWEGGRWRPFLTWTMYL